MKRKNTNCRLLHRFRVTSGCFLLVTLFLFFLPQAGQAISPDLASKLSPDEIGWLEKNKDSIRYAPNPSWPPGDYIEDGKHKGIVSDYIRIFEEKLGVTFKRVYFDSWPDIINGLETARIDFAGALQQTEERDRYMLFTEPFMKTRLTIIVRSDAPRDLYDDINSMTLSCPEDYASCDYVRSTYPGVKIVETHDDLAALLRVSAGATGGAVVDYMVATYLIEKYGITNLTFGSELDFHWDLRFASVRGKSELRSILDKALATISTDEREQIYQKWVGLRLENHLNYLMRHYQAIWVTLAVVLCLLLTSSVFILLLKKQVNERTRHLNDAKDDLQESKTYLQTVLDSVGDAIFVHDAYTGRIIDVNHRMCAMYGCTHEEAIQSTVNDFSQGEPPYSEPEAIEWLRQARETGPQTFEWLARHKDGHCFWVEVTITFTVIGSNDRFVAIVRDLTERKQKIEEHKKLQAMYSQAQKMETVGRLAGGVAHDFNNMLAVIIGYTELAIGRTKTNDPLLEDLKEILTAAQRAAEITRQLLAFARKQTISPRVLDLNEAIEPLLKMLRRLIGEDINLSWQPSSGKTPVFLDPSQLHQILANLCVNSRDAIDGAGNIVIETGTIRLDEEYCSQHIGFIPGDFIVLAVSDDGCGMNQETVAHIFEPFFTTKGIDEGTGLGLATVYGIVKQNLGFINVYSEPGNGTTFRIYLPRHQGETVRSESPIVAEVPSGRNQTVLIVEDEPAILEMSRRILHDNGFTVLATTLPSQAITIAAEHPDRIDLLITDVILPETNGHELAKKLRDTFPHLQVLYMSGYTAHVIAKRGVLDSDLCFIQKPFSIKELLLKVQELLKSGE